MNKPDINKHRLPFGTQDLFDNLGDELTILLMKRNGGRYITVPAQFSPDKLYGLLAIMTSEQLQLLIKHYAGERLLVPKYDRIATQIRDKRIRALRKLGHTDDWLAEKFHLTTRHIYTILNQGQSEELNYDLFDGSMGGEI